MAIQNRRGVYSDFTPSKMVPGELAVVQSGDPNNTSGKAVYAAFGASGDVKRLATEDDLGSVDTALGNKVDKVSGKGLSANDYTNTEKTKLAGIAPGAEVNVQSDWNQSNASADDFIKNKPTKTSDFTNDGDGTSNFATESYVQLNGGKIDTISVNGTQQTITNKNVDIPVPVIDSTLTQTGKAADAKVVGDELASVKSDFYVSTVDAIEPSLIRDGILYGASPYDIRNDVAAALAIYKVEGGKTYKIISAIPRPRFSAACFADFPVTGSAAISGTYQSKHGQGATEISITVPSNAQYIAVYFYNTGFDSVSITEAIRALYLFEYENPVSNLVDIDSFLQAIIYGASPYDIRSDSSASIAIYKIEPNTNYVLHSNIARPRFSIAQYTSKPAIGSTPISGTYIGKHNQSATEISFTSASTAQYVATYFYNSAFDTTVTRAEVVAGMTLTNTDVVPVEPVTLEEVANNAFGNISNVYKNMQYITAKGVVPPAYVLDAILYGAGTHDIRSDSSGKLAVYRVFPGMTYKVKSESMRPRFAVGCFNESPVVGSVPTAYYQYSGQSEFTITADSDAKSIGLYFFNSAIESGTAEEALAEITVSGATYTSLESVLALTDSELQGVITDRDSAKTEFTFCTWNIGHFSMGVHEDTDITSTDYATKLKAYNDLIISCKPDVIAVEEYSRVFANLGAIAVNTDDVLFGEFINKFIGEQKHYSCNAVFCNFHVRGMEQVEYECNRNAVITHTTLIEAQDYYYVRWNMVVNGRDILCIATHLAFDTNYPDVLQQAQIDELISVCSDAPYVMIFGDFNTTNFNSFKNAGYTMVSNSGIPFVEGVDNIVCKGLDIVEKKRINISNTLSDHYMFLGKIKISV